jgi:hypothetical protein
MRRSQRVRRAGPTPLLPIGLAPLSASALHAFKSPLIPAIATPTAAIRNDRSTSTPAVCCAQEAAIRRRLGERAKSGHSDTASGLLPPEEISISNRTAGAIRCRTQRPRNMFPGLRARLAPSGDPGVYPAREAERIATANRMAMDAAPVNVDRALSVQRVFPTSPVV